MSESVEQSPVPIHVLVGDIPDPLYNTIAQQLEAAPDMQLVGRVKGLVELLLAVDDGVEIVLLGAPHATPRPGICSHLLNEYAHLKVFVVAADTGDLNVYWRGLRRRRLRISSLQTLIDHIRQLHEFDVTA